MLIRLFPLKKISSLQLHRPKYANLRISIQRHYSIPGKGDVLRFSTTNGMEHFRNRSLNKGLAFTREERFALGLHGLMPGRVKTLAEQIEQSKMRLNMIEDNLEKFIYLSSIHQTNEKLFYGLLAQNTNQLTPIVYTPTVARAVKNHGILAGHVRALYVTIHDRGHIFRLLEHWPERDVIASVVTDGERCLGLGDMGLCSVYIAAGKMALYTAFGKFIALLARLHWI